MPVIISDGIDEVISGCFSMRLSIYNEFLNLIVIDGNPEFHEPWNQEKKSRTPCFVARKFVFVKDTGTKLSDDLCVSQPCHPPPCPPDPCYTDDSTTTPHPYPQQHEDAEPNQLTSSPTGNFFPKPDEVFVYGFRELGGIKRSNSQTLTYYYRIPLTEFPVGFSLFQLYLEDKNGLPTLLLSKGIENVNAVSSSVSANDMKMLTDQIKTKADKADVEGIRTRVEQLGDEQGKIKSSLDEIERYIKNLDDMGQKPGSKGKAPQ